MTNAGNRSSIYWYAKKKQPSVSIPAHRVLLCVLYMNRDAGRQAAIYLCANLRLAEKAGGRLQQR